MSGKNSILGLSEQKKSRISGYFNTYEHLKRHAQLSWAWKKFLTSGPDYLTFVNNPVTVLVPMFWWFEAHNMPLVRLSFGWCEITAIPITENAQVGTVGETNILIT